MWDALGEMSVKVADVEQALSADNLYFASLRLGHSPSFREALQHFFQHKQPGRVISYSVSGAVGEPKVFPHVSDGFFVGGEL